MFYTLAPIFCTNRTHEGGTRGRGGGGRPQSAATILEINQFTNITFFLLLFYIKWGIFAIRFVRREVLAEKGEM